MKKIISAMLTLALLASFYACGNTNGNETQPDTTTAQTTETTVNTATESETTEITETTETTESEEEKALKAMAERYEKANAYLEEYLKTGSFRDEDWNTYSKNAAPEYLYKEFEALGDYEDSAEILSRFTVFPDMLTSITLQKIDRLGNVEHSEYATYQYDQKGTSNDAPMIKFLGLGKWDHVQYEYDPTGRITSIKLGNVSAIVTPEYDENGNIVKTTIQTADNTYTSTYTYDEKNRLISEEEYQYNGGSGYDGEYWKHYSYNYTYDENGNLAKQVYTYVLQGSKRTNTITYSYYENGDLQKKDTHSYDHTWNDEFITETTFEYEYDENGYLLTEKKIYISSPGTSKQSQTITQLIYTNDENGNPITAELIESQDGKNSYVSQILTYNYETLYFYHAQ